MFATRIQEKVCQKDIYILADLGLTMSGSLSEAKNLCRVAKENGADGVKFQCIYADYLLGDLDVTYTYTTWVGERIEENMHAMFSALDMEVDEWRDLRDCAESLGLDFICTAHTERAFDVLEEIEVPIHKICTWSLNHYSLIKKIANTGKGLIVDLGMVSEIDLDELCDFYKSSGGGDVIPLFDLHTSNVSQMNFRGISILGRKFKHFGYTAQDHSVQGDYLAVALGAQILEKRLTLNKARRANGHWKALEPSEFYRWTSDMRKAKQMLGEEILQPSDEDVRDSKKYFKSAWAKRDIMKGECIKPEDFYFRRPGTGLSSRQVLKNDGRMIAKLRILRGTMVTEDHVEFV